MEAIRQFIEVKDNTFQVVLPEGFTAKNVEVIIMPTQENNDIPEWQKKIVRNRIKNAETPVDAFEMITEMEKDIEKL
jgi:molybdopterin-guanine dinucleotide biosynthesis protein